MRWTSLYLGFVQTAMLLAQNIFPQVEGIGPTLTAIRGSHVACNTALRGVRVRLGIL